MTGFTVSVSGAKAEAIRQADQQLPEQHRAPIRLLIHNAPGTHVSLSGSLNASTDGSHGSISLSGSFWTPSAQAGG